MKRTLNYLYFIFILGLISCDNGQNRESTASKEFTSSIPKVKTALVQESSFLIDINSNGKLEAKKKVDLKFENEGVIEKLFVNDGDIVKKGQILAYQPSNHLISEGQKNKEVLTKARLNMEDVLLGFGYSLKDSLNIPKETFNMAKSRSGISEANYQIIQTGKKYRASRLVAPFSGVIANLSAKEKSLSSMSDRVCTLIDNKELLVSFYILEKEFGVVEKGDIVTIVPIALPDKKFSGQIKHINPIINEHGLISIKAVVDNKSNLLIDGMNVNVSIHKKINQVISVPKKAVVERQDRKVIFTFNNGRSKWNYIKTNQETRDSIIIVEGLKVGDQIIIDGNVNLAHDTVVELEE